MADYATVTDIIRLKRNLTNEEQERAEALIPVVCDALRFEAKKTGRDLDSMIFSSEISSKRDIFEADGSEDTFELSEMPQQVTAVLVNNNEMEGYAASGKTVKLDKVPDAGSEILIVYRYRVLLGIARSVTVDIVMRELMTSTQQEPMTQMTESALGYSMSGTFLSPGGGIFIKKDELKRLGLRRQRYGVLEFYEEENGNA